jgi:hypothetical protein
VSWTCETRYAPYELGQRAVFFLQQERNKDGSIKASRPWFCMGTEGECLFDGDKVNFNRWLPLPLPEFAAAIRGLRERFEWEYGPSRRGDAYPESLLRQTCTDAELEAFLDSSVLARAMVRGSWQYKDLKTREAGAEQGK